MTTACEELHNRLQEHYDYRILLIIDFPNDRAIYRRVGTDKEVIISGDIFKRYPLELIFIVICVKGWLVRKEV